MAADEGAAGLVDLGLAAQKDLVEHLRLEFAGGKTGDIERGERLAAHGIYVAERIGGRDRPEGERVVDDGREEVDGLHQGLGVADAIDTGVVGEVETDQQIGVFGIRQTCQSALQFIGAQFGGSAAACDHLRQALCRFMGKYFFCFVHRIF